MRARLGVVAPRPESRRVWLAVGRIQGSRRLNSATVPDVASIVPMLERHAERGSEPIRITLSAQFEHQRPSAGVVTQRVRSAVMGQVGYGALEVVNEVCEAGSFAALVSLGRYGRAKKVTWNRAPSAGSTW